MSSSIFLVVVFFLLAVSKVEPTMKRSEFPPKVLELADALHSTCLPRSGTDEESINKVIDGEFTDEPKIKAYMQCLMDESELVDENGELIMDLIIPLTPPKIFDEALKNTKFCDGERKEVKERTDKAFVFFKCIYGKNPDTFIFF
uniref:Odorant binding protein 1 n=1 Tax=Monochamus alternatus TaxID=192382 RepID=A6YIT8_MONAT|nr:odorant binding protein 1 [Monochamus alternatus]